MLKSRWRKAERIDWAAVVDEAWGANSEEEEEEVCGEEPQEVRKGREEGRFGEAVPGRERGSSITDKAPLLPCSKLKVSYVNGSVLSHLDSPLGDITNHFVTGSEDSLTSSSSSQLSGSVDTPPLGMRMRQCMLLLKRATPSPTVLQKCSLVTDSSVSPSPEVDCFEDPLLSPLVALTTTTALDCPSCSSTSGSNVDDGDYGVASLSDKHDHSSLKNKPNSVTPSLSLELEESETPHHAANTSLQNNCSPSQSSSSFSSFSSSSSSSSSSSVSLSRWSSERCLTPSCSLETIDPSKPRKLFPVFERCGVNKKDLRKRKREEVESEEQRETLKVKRKRRRKSKKLEQLHLDFGQKTIGHVTCKVCGMVYTMGQEEDLLEHTRFHNFFLTRVKFTGWKKEHVVQEFSNGRIILILPSDPRHQHKKVEELCKLVDAELGYAVGLSARHKGSKVFLYISQQKRVIGCVIAEEITQGYPIVPQESSEGALSSWQCSTTPEPAVVGINRMWVSSSHRRQGVATRLVDSVRANFLQSGVVSLKKIAFSDPTPDGHAFASRYCATPSFLVYRWCN